MQDIYISGTGVWTPPHKISNKELVAPCSINACPIATCEDRSSRWAMPERRIAPGNAPASNPDVTPSPETETYPSVIGKETNAFVDKNVSFLLVAGSTRSAGS